jgi:aminoglycoside phosphotransferase (APT) family kinase protein
VLDRTWAPEIVVDDALAAALIESQFPQLRPVVVTPLSAGWDASVFRVNTEFVFRFPRRHIAAPLIDTELKCLDALASQLPVPIPRPLFAGRPSDNYPWPFAGYTYLAGTRAVEALRDDRSRGRVVEALGRFLKALHAIRAADVRLHTIPFDELDRLNARKRLAITEGRLAHLRSTGVVTPDQSSTIVAIVREAPDPPQSDRYIVVHGDLHAGQLFIDDDGNLGGVIDWSDVHLGYPAVDLAIVHQMLPPSLHDRFRDAYGPIDVASWQLAKARAAWHAVALLISAIDVGDTMLAHEARTGLANVL